jgi:(R,R)-butanediol dehydrogenase/meso-butanediol dehydrogenase/diacetyl reductase
LRAARLHGVEDVRVEDLPEPEPGQGEVKVKVAACGICGSDLHLYKGAGLRQGAEFEAYVLGHEFSGEVVAVGEGVTDRALGDRVAVRPTVTCGMCGACQAGATNVCRALRFYGVTSPLAGGMGEYVVVASANCHLLPTSVDLVDGALVEPLAVGLHAVRRGGATDASTVAIFGAGPIGIGIYLNLRATGVEQIFVIEPSPLRRQAIAGLGADVVLDPSSMDVRAEIHRLTQGHGVQVCFESAGQPVTFTDAQRVTARQGRIVIVAAYEKPVTFDPFFLLSTEQTLTAALAYTPEDFDAVLGLMATGAYPQTGWVEHLALEDIVGQGFEALQDQRATKLLVRL